MNIKEAKTEEDAEQIAVLAAAICTEHYTPILGIEQVIYMLETLQSKEAIWRSMQEGFVYWLVISKEEPIGYAGYRLTKNSLFLSKLYLKRSVRGKGYGKKFMQI